MIQNTRRWQPYPAYKPSGVPWLGDIPAHWEVRRLKSVARFIYGDSLAAEERERGNVPVYGSNGQIDVHSVANTFAPVIVIGRKGSFGKINFSEVPVFAIDTTYFIDSRNTSADLKWLAHVLQLLNLDQASQDSAIPGLSRDVAYTNFIPAPSVTEQHAIAAFLDRETARLDTLIAKNEQLIERLQEKRTALISRAVTKGLDANARMKDSGVEWLGEVPERWEVRRLKQIADVNFSGVDKHSLENEIPAKLCNYVDVYKNERITSGIEFMRATASADEIKNFTLAKDDILITKDSESWTDIAVPAIVTEELENVLCGYHLALVRPNPKMVDGEFLFRAFQATTINYQFQVEATGITRYGIDQYAISNTIFPLLPIEEQRAIAAYLNEQTARLDALVTKIQDGIARLREYRGALIAAAVTGKVDVRDTA